MAYSRGANPGPKLGVFELVVSICVLSNWRQPDGAKYTLALEQLAQVRIIIKSMRNMEIKISVP